jgi:serine/threonine protein phosphatase PrpC
MCPACQAEQSDGSESCNDCGKMIVETVIDLSDDDLEPISEEEMVLVLSEPIVFNPKIEIAKSTNAGLVKENNEDYAFIDFLEFSYHNVRVDLLVLADGMGGAHGGELFARKAVIKTVDVFYGMLPFFEKQLEINREEFIVTLCERIKQLCHVPANASNTHVNDFAKQRKVEQGNYGATFAYLILVSDFVNRVVTVYGYNSGDVKIVFLQNQKIEILSEEHAIAGAPYRFMGMGQYVAGKPIEKTVPMDSEFVYMLMTDGIHKVLTDEQILSICLNANNAQDLSEKLVHESVFSDKKAEKSEGQSEPGSDNSTVVSFMCRNGRNV